ncbi:MAG: CoA pyrophosphatase [Gemmatimonadota bacterium]
MSRGRGAPIVEDGTPVGPDRSTGARDLQGRRHTSSLAPTHDAPMYLQPLDLRFDRIRAGLDPASLNADGRPFDARPGREAAVAIVLRPAAEDLEFLLVKRAESPRDPWSGHMALPGGRRDPGDPNLVATAIRETAEETRVLLDSSWTLGRLDSISPQSRRLPTLDVHPFVFAAPSRTEAFPEAGEIASVHWVPLAHLLDPSRQRTVDIPLIGTIREFPAYELDGRIVWGLTYRILKTFIESWRTPRSA